MTIQFKQKIHSNQQLALGSWMSLGHPAVAEMICNAGFEWLAIDLEHSMIDLQRCEELIRVVDLMGRTPLVRLSSNDAVQIKRVMDAGAHGIIVPMVNTRQDAEQAVAAAYFPPVGLRGVGLARAQGYGSSFKSYHESTVGSRTVVIVQIEHKTAVANLEEILSVKGVDAFLIGPYDLSMSLGIPGDFSHPLMVATLKRVTEVGKKLGKTCGIHIVEPDQKALKDRFAEGYRLIAYSVDFRMIDVMCRSAIESMEALK